MLITLDIFRRIRETWESHPEDVQELLITAIKGEIHKMRKNKHPNPSREPTRAHEIKQDMRSLAQQLRSKIATTNKEIAMAILPQSDGERSVEDSEEVRENDESTQDELLSLDSTLASEL